MAKAKASLFPYFYGWLWGQDAFKIVPYLFIKSNILIILYLNVASFLLRFLKNFFFKIQDFFFQKNYSLIMWNILGATLFINDIFIILNCHYQSFILSYSGFSRKTGPVGCVWLFLIIRFIIRNWITWLWRLGSSKPGKKRPVGWKPSENWCCTSGLETIRLETQGELMLQFQYKGNHLENPVLLKSWSIHLFHWGLHLIAWGPSTLWRIICFTQSPLI